MTLSKDHVTPLDQRKQFGKYYTNPTWQYGVKAQTPFWVCILKEKRNAYFEFQNGGFILRTLFFLISAIYNT